MRCKQFEQSISDYLDGLLNQEQHRAFAEHRLACAPCRALIEDVQTVVNSLREAPEIEAPPALQSHLFAIYRSAPGMSCFECEELITDFLDGFIEAPVYHAFEEHINLCPSCSSLLTDVVYAIAACHSLHFDEQEVAESLVTGILKATSDGAKIEPAPAWRRLWAVCKPFFNPVMSPQFATATLILISSFAVLLTSTSNLYSRLNLFGGRLYSKSTAVLAQKDSLIENIRLIRGEVSNFIVSSLDTLEAEKKRESESDSSPETRKQPVREDNGKEKPMGKEQKSDMRGPLRDTKNSSYLSIFNLGELYVLRLSSY